MRRRNPKLLPAVAPVGRASGVRRDSRHARSPVEPRPAGRRRGWLATVFAGVGQRHADLIEGLLHTTRRARRTPDCALYLLVDPWQVRRALNQRIYSQQQMWLLLKGLVGAVVEIEHRGGRILGHLIDEVVAANEPVANLLGGDRKLWRVKIGAAGVQLLQIDIPLFCDPASIARLQYGISKAVAQHALTHQSSLRVGWILHRLIEAVCGEITPQRRWRQRLEIAADGDQLGTCGIVVMDGRITRNVSPPARG